MALLGVVNLITISITIILVYIVLSKDSYVHLQLNELSQNNALIQMRKKDNVTTSENRLLYLRQKFNYRVEDYFLEDIYNSLYETERNKNVTNDYLIILINAIITILSNKSDFEQNYKIYDTPDALKYPYYLPLAKYGKYTIDYDKYLKNINAEELIVQLNNYYPNFRNDDRYFLIIKNEKCTQRAHVLLFLEKAIKLYLNEPVRVDQCIYYNICALVPTQEQCKII